MRLVAMPVWLTERCGYMGSVDVGSGVGAMIGMCFSMVSVNDCISMGGVDDMSDLGTVIHIIVVCIT